MAEERGAIEAYRYSYDTSMHIMERANKRLAIALMISIVVIFVCNAAWLWAWCQYDYTSEETVYEYQQDGEGLNIIGNSNEVSNIGAESHSN